ncbi:hypothetical protein BGZ98_010102 [Dissophora globulifera]|nr:hypothetical protein BGZ98_010102 [Dissophora globulifera]
MAAVSTSARVALRASRFNLMAVRAVSRPSSCLNTHRTYTAWTHVGSAKRSTFNSSISNQSAAAFSTTSVWRHGALPRPAPGTGFKVNFITQDGETVTVEANDGESLLDVARANDLDVEGACEASLACSTCHLILDEESYNKLEEPSDEENDMLDLAFGLTDTSRLGCQVLMSKELDGLIAKIPSATRNMYVDGAKPKHH